MPANSRGAAMADGPHEVADLELGADRGRVVSEALVVHQQACPFGQHLVKERDPADGVRAGAPGERACGRLNDTDREKRPRREARYGRYCIGSWMAPLRCNSKWT